MIESLPKPRVPWEPVYELLRCLGEVSHERSDLATQCATLIAGMQGGEEIDEWLLWELLALATVDRTDVSDHRAVASAFAPLVGTGLVNVRFEAGSSLEAAIEAEHETLSLGLRERARYRARVVEQMRRVEVGLRAAMEIAEASELEEDL